tara:strand:+ start:554 stop:766 length:213 start_codon:yes stop_codon:yes gene_type:complete
MRLKAYAFEIVLKVRGVGEDLDAAFDDALHQIGNDVEGKVAVNDVIYDEIDFNPELDRLDRRFVMPSLDE